MSEMLDSRALTSTPKKGKMQPLAPRDPNTTSPSKKSPSSKSPKKMSQVAPVPTVAFILADQKEQETPSITSTLALPDRAEEQKKDPNETSKNMEQHRRQLQDRLAADNAYAALFPPPSSLPFVSSYSPKMLYFPQISTIEKPLLTILFQQ